MGWAAPERRGKCELHQVDAVDAVDLVHDRTNLGILLTNNNQFRDVSAPEMNENGVIEGSKCLQFGPCLTFGGQPSKS